MLRGNLQIEIEAKPEIVFDLLADITKLPIWHPKVTEVSLTPEEPIKKGANGRVAFKTGRRRMVYEFICHEYDRPKTSSIEVTSGSEISKMSYEFTPTEKGTKISFQLEFQPKGYLRLLEPFIKLFKRLIMRQEQKELQTLKEYLTKNK